MLKITSLVNSQIPARESVKRCCVGEDKNISLQCFAKRPIGLQIDTDQKFKSSKNDSSLENSRSVRYEGMNCTKRSNV